MNISEIFYSIQGEGILAGVPSIFVRTSGCNLRCVWCDTPYTSWNPEGNERSIGQILDEVATYPARHVVVTGGEPLIAPEMPALTSALRKAGHHITIETAGTVFVDLACDLMSISPKLANSTPHQRDAGRWAIHHDRTRYRPDILKHLIASYDYQLKFVVSNPSDLTEIDEMRVTLEAPKHQVLLMPEGTNHDAIRERGLWIAEICKREGYRFSPRLHVNLWGDRRGV